MSITPKLAAAIVQADVPKVLGQINKFTSETFLTRGGRLGSGMGSLLEALWVYFMNRTLANEGGEASACELAWLQDHEPADFACLIRGADWDPRTRGGELLRIEAKSMNVGVDEAKGHFANLAQETQDFDQLLVMIWSWSSTSNGYFWPKVHDYFIGNAMPIIALRDFLHRARGGAFIQAGHCPDGCAHGACTHIGEPLNAEGRRERKSGPASAKPANVSYAANFGGLVRMLKTNSPTAREVLRKIRREDEDAHRYISFIYQHFPTEEANQYLRGEWAAAASALGAQNKLTHAETVSWVRSRPGYQNILRNLQ